MAIFAYKNEYAAPKRLHLSADAKRRLMAQVEARHYSVCKKEGDTYAGMKIVACDDGWFVS